MIDLVNHGGRGANADVRQLKSAGSSGTSGASHLDGDPYATSLVSTRPIAAGEELLLDYGGGGPVDNERLLLDFGFVLPGNAGDNVGLRLQEDFLPGLSTLDAQRSGMRDVAELEQNDLGRLINAVLKYVTVKQAGQLLCTSTGAATGETLALALTLSCRGPDDVARLLTPSVVLMLDAADDAAAAAAGGGSGGGAGGGAQGAGGGQVPEQLLRAVVEGSTPDQLEFAMAAIRAGAGRAIEHIQEGGDVSGGFGSVARQYGAIRREVLQRVVGS